MTGTDHESMFRAAIERYTPPGVLIDGDNQVVHFSGNASRYLRLPGGESTRDVLRLVPELIAYRLQEGLRAVRQGRGSWRSAPFVVAMDSKLRRMVLRIDRADAGPQATERSAEPSTPAMLHQPNASETLLVVFDDASGAIAPDSPGVSAVQPAREPPRKVVQELETAREELQMVNEKLLSLNDENQHRIETLAQGSDELLHLLESTGLATLLVDRSLNIVRFTPLAAALFHLKRTDVGRSLSEVKSPLRYPDLVPDLRRVIEHLAEFEREIMSEDEHWFVLRAHPYRSALQDLEGAVLVLIDITDRKIAELALREADRRKDEFIAVLAHELRNPLAPIAAGIEVLHKIPDDPTLVRQVAVTMGRQSQQLVRLVDDLLEVSRISGGKLTLRIAPVQIAEVVRDSVAAVRPFLETLKHQLTVAVPDETLMVEGDATRLTQIIGNLLHNAGRYTPSGGRISLVARRLGEKVQISIRDNGLGISSQSLPSVFEMFYQGNDLAAANSAGLGIGLTLAKKLVEMHAGTIRAESAGPNTGSTFTVCLPLARPPVRSSELAAKPQASPAAEAQRVLIVDDNADAAETLRLLMTTMGSGEVRTAANGVEALTVGAQLRPDVVLLDLGMPGMDGYEVARRMRGESWGKEALLIALTGWGQEQHRHRTKEAGFDRHMTKPADAEALRAVLDRASAH